MGEARRRKLAAAATSNSAENAAKRAELLALAHNALLQSDDPTVSGMTLFLPSGESIYLSAEDARKANRNRSEQN